MLAERGIEVDLDRIPWDDPEVYAFLQRGETVGVFQLESEGMRRTLAAVKPDNFGDIIALVSLYRPGPMDNIPMFGARKNGREPIEYPHPLLEEVLKETYGIFVYQEQVMEAAKVLAGFSLGEADLLRRAMGKKIKSEMDAQRAGFVEGCAAGQRHPRGQGQRAVRLDRQVRRLRLQQEPRRRLRAGRLSDRLAEGAPSGRILRRLDVLRHDADRQARHLRRRHAAHRRRLPAARDQRQRGRILGRGPWRGPCRPLRARRAQGRRREGDGATGRRAAARTARSPASTISPRGSIRACSTAARSKASPAAAPSTASPSAGRSPPRPRPSSPPPPAPPTRGSAGRAACSAKAPPMSSRSACRPARAGRWPSAWRPRRRASASISPPIRSTITAISPRRNGARSFAELGALPASAEGGRIGAVMAGLVEDTRWRTSARGRRYMMATLSDSSGQFEATVFDDQVAEQVADAAKAGGCALLNVELDRRPGEETPRVTIRSLQPFESLARRTRLQIEVEVEDEAAVRRLAAAVAGEHGGTGQLRLEATLGEGRGRSRPRPRFPARRRARRALRAARGRDLGDAQRHPARRAEAGPRS